MVSMPWQQVRRCAGLWVLKVVGVATTTFLQLQKESWTYNDIWLCDPRVTTHFTLLQKGSLNNFKVFTIGKINTLRGVLFSKIWLFGPKAKTFFQTFSVAAVVLVQCSIARGWGNLIYSMFPRYSPPWLNEYSLNTHCLFKPFCTRVIL